MYIALFGLIITVSSFQAEQKQFCKPSPRPLFFVQEKGLVGRPGRPVYTLLELYYDPDTNRKC